MRWPRFLRSYFTFNRREQRGLFTLLLILVVLCGSHLAIKMWPKESAAISPSRQAQFDALAVKIHEGGFLNSDEKQPSKSNNTYKNAEEKVQWFAFDPNTISVDKLMTLGLSQDLAERIINYREKVGAFEQKEELYKIYDIDTNWVQKAMSFVEVDPVKRDEESQSVHRSTKHLKAPKTAKEEKAVIEIDLNRSDTAELKRIPGIGSFFAEEIVETRNRFGGIRTYDQLMGIYMMKDEVLNALVAHTFIDTNAVARIDINNCRVEDLGKHPYISWRQAKIIINYRKQRGPFRTTEDILSTDAIPDSVYTKIAPYLIAR